MANRVAILCSDRGSLPETVGDAGVVLPLPGWLTPVTTGVPTRDEVRPWIDATIRLWDHPADRGGMGGPGGDCADGRDGNRLERGYADFFRGLSPARAVMKAIPSVRSKWVVLVPYLSTIEPECEQSLKTLEMRGIVVVRCRGSSAIDLARNTLTSDALRRGFESILFIDADIAFDPVDAMRLLARPEPVISGVYPKKGVQELSSTFAKGVAEVTFGRDVPGPYPLDHAATGFLRIKADALTRMIKELGLPLCNERGGAGLWPFFLPCIVPLERGFHYLPEDWAFSQRLRDMGITPLADTSIRLFHLGSYGYSWEYVGTPLSRYQKYTYRMIPAPGKYEAGRHDRGILQ